MSAAAWVLGLAAVLFAAGLGAALVRPHPLSPLVAGQAMLLGGVLAVVVLLGGEGRLLAVAAVAAAGAQAGLVLALVRRASADESGDPGDPGKTPPP